MSWASKGITGHMSGWAWARLRARILQRDSHRCQVCGSKADTVDHILALALGGSPDAPSNLRALCNPCHTLKSHADRSAAQRQWGKLRAQRRRQPEPHPGMRSATRW